jgi:geranylgeranyl diphosphate synthase, type II
VTGFSLEAFLAREVGSVETALADVVAREAALLDVALEAPVRYALGTRGKRLRPILCVAAYRATRGGGAVPDAVYRLACALEVVHTYSLVHDDLPCMDDDDLRRGRPTVHRVHGVALATVAGAALLPLAVRVLLSAAAELDVETDVRRRLVAELCGAAGARGMVGGQLMDLEGEARPVDARGLEAIHRRKTGALLAASLRIGALAARADAAAVEALTRYGEAVGLAFQIADDVLDVTAATETLGKTAGKDAQTHKATYPSLHGVEGARALAREREREAVDALAAAGLRSPSLEALARYVVERQ